MKCEHCDYISFDHNLVCPACGGDLSSTRTKLGLIYEPPETTFEELFRIESTPEETEPQNQDDEIELIIDDDDFEFTLDD